MKNYVFFLILSGLILTNVHISPMTVQLTKKEIVVNSLKKVGTQAAACFAPLGRGLSFAGQKITHHKKLIFISAGIASLTGLSLYLNSDKINNSKKPEALFGQNKSFNPFHSRLVEKTIANVKDGFNILDAVRIVFGMNPTEKASVKALLKEKNTLNESVSSLETAKTNLENEKTNLENEKTNLENEKKNIQKNLEEKTNKLNEVTIKIKNLETSLEKEKKSAADLTEEIKKIKNESIEKLNEKVKLEDSLKNAQQKIKDLEEEFKKKITHKREIKLNDDGFENKELNKEEKSDEE